MSNGIDNFMDYSLKRWPIVVAIAGLVLGVAKMGWVQTAQAEDIADLKTAIVEIKNYNETFRQEYRQDRNKDADLLRSMEERIIRAVKT